MNVYPVLINAYHVIKQQHANFAREIDLIIQFVIVLMVIMKMKYLLIVKFVLEIVLHATKKIVSHAEEIEF